MWENHNSELLTFFWVDKFIIETYGPSQLEFYTIFFSLTLNDNLNLNLHSNDYKKNVPLMLTLCSKFFAHVSVFLFSFIQFLAAHNWIKLVKRVSYFTKKRKKVRFNLLIRFKSFFSAYHFKWYFCVFQVFLISFLLVFF